MDPNKLYEFELDIVREQLRTSIIHIPDSMIEGTAENEKLFNVFNRMFDNIFKILIDMTVFNQDVINAMHKLQASYIDEILMYTVNRYKVKEILEFIHLVVKRIHTKAMSLELYEVAANCYNFENFNKYKYDYNTNNSI